MIHVSIGPPCLISSKEVRGIDKWLIVQTSHHTPAQHDTCYCGLNPYGFASEASESHCAG